MKSIVSPFTNPSLDNLATNQASTNLFSGQNIEVFRGGSGNIAFIHNLNGDDVVPVGSNTSTTPTTENQRQKTMMKSSKKLLGTKVAAYAIGAAAFAGRTTTAHTAIIYTDPPDISVPNNIDGVYLDLTTGQASLSSIAGYDLNPFAVTAGMSILTPMDGGGALADVGGPAGEPVALAAGALIGADSPYRDGATVATNFRVTGTEFLGLRFVNDDTGAINYGWVEFTTTGNTGFPATINRFAYEDTGASILAGQTAAVPEPGTTAMLGTLGIGAAGLRAWRRRQKAA